MQTIARANRVFPDKKNGLIVDYVGVFRTSRRRSRSMRSPARPGEVPVKDKAELVDGLREAVDDRRAFCGTRSRSRRARRSAGFDLVAAGRTTVEKLIVDDEEKIAFLARASLVDRLFKAILPDKRANEFGRLRAVPSSSPTRSPITE